ncbi:hypothetical protein HPB49_009343 [Dermacentor silvarum]|uniref:Uncharacterized protein n=1 Tax=Dermacentor silvarum TaxID=543639 RepID=A0ACB8DXY0_DERSI|nr:hypothetical protein HPB49_009343 [Dermacentor silvarum]
MNTAPSAASSRASSPTRHPPHKRRSPSSDDVAPERDIVRKTACVLEAFEQRVMLRFVRLEERIASVDNRVATIESHLTALDTRVAVLEARQSATEATLAHLSLPTPLNPAPTPTPSDPFGRRPCCHIHTPCSTTLHRGRQPSTALLGGLSRCPPPVAGSETQSPRAPPFGPARTIRLIRRIANRHHGMREHDLRRLVQAFVLSRFIYSLPYIFLSRTEEDKVNSLIRQAYKSALSLPTSTSTTRLLSMGVHNSLTEPTEAHRTAQLLRLSRTRPDPFPSTTNTCGATFRPTPFLLLHVLPSSTPGRTRRPAAYVTAPAPITITCIFFSCPAHLPPAYWHLTSPQQWEAALSSTEPDLQLRLVTWAEDVATRHGLDATTGSLKATHNAAF